MIKYVCQHDYPPYEKGMEYDSVPEDRLIGTVFVRVNRPDHVVRAVADDVEKIADAAVIDVKNLFSRKPAPLANDTNEVKT